jgi:hypothetical protein
MCAKHAFRSCLPRSIAAALKCSNCFPFTRFCTSAAGRTYLASPGHDLQGHNISFIEGTTKDHCQSQCDTTHGCAAFTFGDVLGGRCSNCCWLKATLGPLTPTPGLTLHTPTSKTYTSSCNVDAPGHDMHLFPDTTQFWCQSKCEVTEGCVAFLYGNATTTAATATGETSTCSNCCWLKHTLGPLMPHPGLTIFYPVVAAQGKPRLRNETACFSVLALDITVTKRGRG